MAYDRILYLLDFHELEAPSVAEHKPGWCGLVFPGSHGQVLASAA